MWLLCKRAWISVSFRHRRHEAGAQRAAAKASAVAARVKDRRSAAANKLGSARSGIGWFIA